MKFSWKILNFFIDLEKIPTQEFINKLNLSGLEIEELTDCITLSDKTVHLNITANRKEIFCVVNLAIELSMIFCLPLRKKLTKIKLIEPQKQKFFFPYLKCIKSHKIYNLTHKNTPNWLKNYLTIYEIKSISLINDIQKYIEIKWGHKFYVFDLNKLEQNKNIHYIDKKNFYLKYINQLIYHKKDNLYFHCKKQYQEKNNIIIYFAIYEINQNNLKNSITTFNGAYEETIKLITSYTKSTISKSTEYYSNLEIDNKNSILNINKNDIKSLLGPIKNTKSTFLSTQDIFNILKQLNFQPIYFNFHKVFQIKIPPNRNHDLKRQVDIIEEIGRIYGFETFLNKLPIYKNKGNISFNFLYLKIIRNALLQTGLNEVLNLSLLSINKSKEKKILICNPLIQEQTSLRTNIIDNLIKIYKQNINNKIFNTEIFEIGKVFYINKSNQVIEESYLGGLIHNNDYLQADWYNPRIHINWFHAKGIIEKFLEITAAQTEWKKLKELKHISNLKYSQENYCTDKTIFIYNNKNKELVGVFGELNNKNIKEAYRKNTYLFEINIARLLKCLNYNKHYKYIMDSYSLYPNVFRDISIKVREKTSINKIKNYFLKNIIDLVESIKIINDYYDKLNKQRSICLRITYRAKYKTLNHIDLKNIDLNIKHILEQLYCQKIKSKS